MIIYDLTKSNNNIIIKEQDIGDTFSEDAHINLFSLSSVNHNNEKNKSFWIVTSYYNDKFFKIYDFNNLINNS